MARRDEGESVLLFVLGVILLREWWEGYQQGIAKPIERFGARVYEQVHPKERGHADDLPGHQLTRAKLLEIATAAGFPDPQLAVAIALAESGGVPGAKGDNRRSIGLWQINLDSHPSYDEEALKDPATNAAAAFAISKQGKDWRPWTTFRNGAYRRFVP